MEKIVRDFVSEEKRDYKFRFGRLIASSLTGFIFGVVAASIIWMVAFSYIQGIFEL
jgi:hypothetical protein